LASLSHELRKDMGIMQDSFEDEVGKGNLFTLIKELSTPLKLVVEKKNSAKGE
jgi:hypothetical protein